MYFIPQPPRISLGELYSSNLISVSLSIPYFLSTISLNEASKFYLGSYQKVSPIYWNGFQHRLNKTKQQKWVGIEGHPYFCFSKDLASKSVWSLILKQRWQQIIIMQKYWNQQDKILQGTKVIKRRAIRLGGGEMWRDITNGFQLQNLWCHNNGLGKES